MPTLIASIINFFKVPVVLGAAIYLKYGMPMFADYLFVVAGVWMVLGLIKWIRGE